MYKYKDNQIKLIKKCLRQLPYFKKISTESIYDIIFSLATKEFVKGDILQEVGDIVEALMFVERGVIEVILVLDEGRTKICVERLFRGSIINFRNYMLNT